MKGVRPAGGAHKMESPPIRGRGLKAFGKINRRQRENVAPHTGAWIEGHDCMNSANYHKGRPPYGGVD